MLLICLGNFRMGHKQMEEHVLELIHRHPTAFGAFEPAAPAVRRRVPAPVEADLEYVAMPPLESEDDDDGTPHLDTFPTWNEGPAPSAEEYRGA